MLDTEKLKKDFLIFNRQINGKPLHYLDNAASSHKPKQVLDAIVDYYSNHNANVHRGIHTLSEEATKMYEDARATIQRFINARFPEEIVFTKGTTDSVNLGAEALASGNYFKASKNTICYSDLEHHSNMLPWQQLSSKAGVVIKALPVDEEGFVSKKQVQEIGNSLSLLAVTHASNFMGTIEPIKDLTKTAHSLGALVFVDGAQAVPHLKVDVQSLGCDFYAFSGHKMLGPMGIGVLYIKKEVQEQFGVYQTGGGMIKEVYLDRAVWADAPAKFEAGTPNVEGAVGLAAAVNYLTAIGMDAVREHELGLLDYAHKKLCDLGGVVIYGPKNLSDRSGLVSFNVAGIHSHDLASVLDTEGVAIRSGHHCTMPMHDALNIPSSARASFSLYNTKEDIDALVLGIQKARKVLL